MCRFSYYHLGLWYLLIYIYVLISITALHGRMTLDMNNMLPAETNLFQIGAAQVTTDKNRNVKEAASSFITTGRLVSEPFNNPVNCDNQNDNLC